MIERCEAIIILITIIIIIFNGRKLENWMGEGEERAEVDLRAASNFLFCVIFPTEECFRENPDTSLEEKTNNFTVLISWRESSCLSIHSN